MKKWVRAAVVLLAVLLMVPSAAFAAEDAGSPDYSEQENWAYYALGEDTGVDVFLICPTVDTESEINSFDLNDNLKARFMNALDMEKGIYEDAGRLFSPYYRQMSMNAYKLTEEKRAAAQEVAYTDISAAFGWYLDHENNGRGLILAGFSQGSQMCLELLKEYYGGENADVLRNNLVAVYAIGWSVTEDMVSSYPQIVPAAGETDTGVVVSFDCEDGSLTDSLVIPAETKALSINPLNWKNDNTKADKVLNLGAVMSTGAEPIPALCGAYIGPRGELVVTDVTADDYPAGIDIFSEGSYHIYDYLFFFENLKANVAARVNSWRTGLPFQDVAAGSWYEKAVSYVYENGLMVGTGDAKFSPDSKLTKAQLVTILWGCAGHPDSYSRADFADVPAGVWYEDAANWAAAEQIVDPARAFDPGHILTREETISLIWNYAKSTGADVSVGEDTNILSYEDAFDITDGYAQAMQWAVGSGLITGTDSSHLSPQGPLTRAQAAVMIMCLPDALRAGQPLSLWTEDAEARTQLIDYMGAITDSNSSSYIPEADRIAVFDMDGTLTCETFYTYYDTMMFIEYCLHDHPERVSDELKEVAASIKPGYVADETLARNFAKAYAGMTVEEFYNYAVEFGQKKTASFNNMRYIDGFYLPMVELVKYLYDNGFEIWVISGTERTTTRAIVANSPIKDYVEPEHVIGTDFEVKQKGYEDEPSNMNFKYENGDELVLTGGFIQKNLNGNKSIYVEREIGKRPVLAFGNSGSDTSMMNYCLDARNPYKAQAYMIVADDSDREWGTQDWETKSADYRAKGFIPISMRNDFVQIYPEGITKADKQYVPDGMQTSAESLPDAA